MNSKQFFDKLNSHLKSNKLKSTKQRDTVVTTFLEWGKIHVSIEDLLTRVRNKNPEIGYATVYRTLLLLVDAGLAHQRHFGKGQSCFELCREWHHDHLICTHCGAIFEFENDDIEALQKNIATKYHFQLSHHKMELYGLCQKCQSK